MEHYVDEDIGPEEVSSSSSATPIFYSVLDADEVLKNMVTRKVAMQNTTLEHDDSDRMKRTKEELISTTENSFDNFISRRSLKREIRQKQIKEISENLSERTRRLERDSYATKESDTNFLEMLRSSSRKRVDSLSEARSREISLSSNTAHIYSDLEMSRGVPDGT